MINVTVQLFLLLALSHRFFYSKLASAKLQKMNIFSFVIMYNYNIHVPLTVTAAAGNTIATLQPIQPAYGPACPGEEVILSCRIRPPTSDANLQRALRWELQNGSTATLYPGGTLNTVLGVFTVSGLSLNKTSISNATLKEALLSHNNAIIGCHGLAEVLNTACAETVIVAGT